MSNVEKVVSNDEQKLIFLKAIILGINYGRSSNAEQYRKNIEDEIIKLAKKINFDNLELQKSFNSFNNFNNQSPLMESNKNESDIIFSKKSKTLEKYENIIATLENQKNNTVALINSLSSNNYGFNYSRINLLKSNLSFIFRELEKNKVIILKLKETENVGQTNQNQPITQKQNGIKAPLFSRSQSIESNNATINNQNQSIQQNIELLKPIQKHFFEKNMNENIIKKSVQFQKTNNNQKPKENLVGELQKTLTGLSSLFSTSDSKKK